MTEVNKGVLTWIARIALFLFSAYIGCFSPFALHMLIGKFAFRGYTESSPDHSTNVRLVFIISGLLAVILPSILGSYLIRHPRKHSTTTAMAWVGIATGALLTMIWLSPGGYAFILR